MHHAASCLATGRIDGPFGIARYAINCIASLLLLGIREKTNSLRELPISRNHLEMRSASHAVLACNETFGDSSTPLADEDARLWTASLALRRAVIAFTDSATDEVAYTARSRHSLPSSRA